MSVAPNSGIVDFGTFTPPTASLNGIQGQVPAPTVAQTAYVLSATGWIAAAAGGGSLLNVQYFQSPGTYTYTKTVGTNKIYCIIIGGGGGGAYSVGSGGGGGGAGGTAIKFVSNASAITTLTVVVGQGGTTFGSSGADGTLSSVSPIGGFTILANPGSGASSYRVGGLGGSTSQSDVNLAGGAGTGSYDAYNVNYAGNVGGYPALFGTGGGGASYGYSGNSGTFGGGGGGGSYYTTAGSGGSGFVVFYEYG
jgi:hypothetical protein